MPTESVTVALLASDLMLTSTVSGFAATASLPFRSCSSAAEAIECASQNPNLLLLVDLGLPGLDVTALASEMPQETLTNAVAYGPHVHTEKLQAATDAGIGLVMSRGQFSSQIGQIIANAAGKL